MVARVLHFLGLNPQHPPSAGAAETEALRAAAAAARRVLDAVQQTGKLPHSRAQPKLVKQLLAQVKAESPGLAALGPEAFAKAEELMVVENYNIVAHSHHMLPRTAETLRAFFAPFNDRLETIFAQKR